MKFSEEVALIDEMLNKLIAHCSYEGDGILLSKLSGLSVKSTDYNSIENHIKKYGLAKINEGKLVMPNDKTREIVAAGGYKKYRRKKKRDAFRENLKFWTWVLRGFR